MMQIELIPMLSDNYSYLLTGTDTDCVAIVDPAEGRPLVDLLEARGLHLSHILNTHHHHDHIGGNDALRAAFGARIIAPASEKARIGDIDIAVADGDRVEIGPWTATVLETPGHTSGHVCFHFADENALFAGDTLFAMGCGRLFEGSPAQMWTSLSRLAALPAQTRLYCGHEYTEANGTFALGLEPENEALVARMGEVRALRADDRPTIPSTIAMERETNPFLRAGETDMAARLGMEGETAEAVFAEIRRRKDAA